MGETVTQYCENEDIGKRLLMTDTQITSDEENLTLAAEEATRLIDLYLSPYEDDLPLQTVPDILADIAADFGASIRKRKYSPTEQKIPNSIPLGSDQVNQEASGWYAIGYSKLMTYLKNIYGKGRMTLITMSDIDSDFTVENSDDEEEEE